MTSRACVDAFNTLDKVSSEIASSDMDLRDLERLRRLLQVILDNISVQIGTARAKELGRVKP